MLYHNAMTPVHTHDHKHAAHAHGETLSPRSDTPIVPAGEAAHLHGDHAHLHTHKTLSPHRAPPPLSLLRMSLAGRLAIALGLSGLIWIAVAWALH